MSEPVGTLRRISEFIVHARLTGPLTMAEQVRVGEEALTAEVIGLAAGSATIQVYEDTTGLRPGAPVRRTGRPLSAVLGPGLIGSVFDGIQRPLDVLRERSGIRIRRGIRPAALDPDRQWTFSPHASREDDVSAGDLLGTVEETPLIEHRILVPPGISGTVKEIAEEGAYGVDDRIAVLADAAEAEHPLTLSQRWSVRRPRPVRERLRPDVPLISGQRVIDTFFPLAKGGAAAIPGGFGTGKTVIQHALAQWSDADIIIYIGCGERGNEMTEVLEDFPRLKDPWSGRPLMERTLLIANTSDMPVSARESSIYTGVTIAEYYRDQGYDVALMADSTSRWAQALREISGRLEEMPIEEGYPAYLPARLSAFYERAGRVETLGGRTASVSLIGAVSPPGGDFSEPVTRHTQRFTQVWWALDRDLAHQRHYPAVDWLGSYSLLAEEVARWWRQEVDGEWSDLRNRAMAVLHEESSLRQLVQLVGPDALSEPQQWVLTGARLLREGFLQQNALHEVDAYSVPEKQVKLLRLLVEVYRKGRDLLDDGIPLHRIRETARPGDLIRLRNEVPNDDLGGLDRRHEALMKDLEGLRSPSGQATEEPEAGSGEREASADAEAPAHEGPRSGGGEENVEKEDEKEKEAAE